VRALRATPVLVPMNYVLGTSAQAVREAPLLLLVAPALHVHPATDTLLRYISPEIEWTLVAIDERWREGVRVVFRKRRDSLSEPNF